MHRLFSLFFVIMLAAACSAEPPANSAGVTPNAAVPTANLPVNDAGVPLVARVNGAEITLPQFERAFARAQQETLVTDPLLLQQSVLDTMIEQVLIEQAAVDLGITVTDADVDAEIQSMITTVGGQQGWETWLAANMYTEAEIREALRATLINNRVQEVLSQQVSTTVMQVHARHILVRTEAEALDILARLENGEDFAALATLSLDVTTRNNGGDLGWFTHDELLEPTVADVAFSLQPGELSGPVATRLGYHIIQTLEFAELPVAPENQAERTQAYFDQWRQSLLENAVIERFI